MRLFTFFGKIRKFDEEEATYTSGIMVSESELSLEEDIEALRQDLIKSYKEQGYEISKDMAIKEVTVEGYEITLRKLAQ
ncbi:hypothetical protein [Peribacillus sp. FSL E2-0159]|uniref:hypothetical protein n=1 Tax=Peribacillus sp. FSL E2-0159 TaxID=2975289 RepID=UPI00315AECFE